MIPSRYIDNPGERLWPRVERVGECMEWQGTRNEHGYGALRVDGRLIKAHRFAWEITHGPIPDGLDVLHSCDNPPCCNPDHLSLGTARDNAAEMVERGRHACSLSTSHLRRGERHPAAKLTTEAVASIRGRVEREPVSALAREFGVARATIRAVRDRQTWKESA